MYEPDFDIAAAHAKNPNYRADFNAHMEKLRSVNINIEKTEEEERAELDYLRRARDGRTNPLEEIR